MLSQAPEPATQKAASTSQNTHKRELLAAQRQRNEKAQRIRKGNRRMSQVERAKTKATREATAAKMERTAKRMVARGQREPQVAKPFTTSDGKSAATRNSESRVSAPKHSSA
ncbi:hypothetical protein WP50_18650 [Lactiplantibacillus plantarum]|nr:hypothetical protein WP50_18650 [Lactiplantibacillus plantarum]